MSVLRIENLDKKYKKKGREIFALKGVDLDIEEGEFVAITGQSGAGKSTLVQILGGLDNPSSGKIFFFDEDISAYSPKKLAEFRSRNIGFIFQNFYLQPFLTLRENIQLPGYFTGKISKNHTELLAKFVGLDDRLEHLPAELSGGQVQRAAIIRALYNNPSIIMADEPTGNLDSKSSAQVQQLLRDIAHSSGRAVVAVTHDEAFAAVADRNIHIVDGKIV